MPDRVDVPDSGRPRPPEHILKAALEVWGQVDQQNLIPISGRSMLPLIQNGDYVLVAHGGSNVQRGAIIVFLQDGKMVIVMDDEGRENEGDLIIPENPGDLTTGRWWSP